MTALLVLVMALTGCDRVRSISMSAPEKINMAFPVSAEIQVAKIALFAVVENDVSEKQKVSDQFGKLMDIRALTCAGTVQIGRLDAPSDVKAKIPDVECFKKQDVMLAEWVGLRRVALALRLPALRPITALPARAVIPSMENAVTMAAAESANIAVVKSNTGKFTVVDLSGGKPLNSFQAPGEAYRFASVSPNGRLMAVPVSNRNLMIYELETGSVLWSTDKYNDMLAWLPQLNAVILNDTSASKAVLMDLQTGRTEPYLFAERNLTWALAMPGAGNQQVIGSQNSAALIDHVRNPDGSLTANILKQWKLNGSGASSLKPMLMLNGKFLAFVSFRDLGWLNLETGQQGVWALSAMGGSGFNKLNETSILYFQHKRGAVGSAMTVLDVEKLTVSTVVNLSSSEGYALPFTPRSGYAKALNSTLVIQTAVESENSQPLDQLLAAAELELQLEKLQATSGQPPQVSIGASGGMPEAGAAAVAAAQSAADAARCSNPARSAVHEQLAREVRAANTAAAIRDGLPRDIVEQFRNGTLPKISGTNRTQNCAQSPVINPLLTDIPGNAQVDIVGVYEAQLDSPRKSGEHIAGGIRVTVASGSTPVVLVLASYEPVRWNIQNPGGRKIAAVLLSGYNESSVMGLSNVKVLKIGSTFAYELNSPGYARLKTDIARYVSNPVRSFQGGYKGREFTISN